MGTRWWGYKSASHSHVDALTWICGKVKSVCAISANRANRLQAEDTLVAAIELENGGLATLELTTAARPRDIEASITITGTKGVVQIGGVALNKIQQWEFADSKDNEKEIIKKFSEEVDNGYGISHYRQLKKIFKASGMAIPISSFSSKRMYPYS